MDRCNSGDHIAEDQLLEHGFYGHLVCKLKRKI